MMETLIHPGAIIISFREVLEIAIIFGVLMAALAEVPGRVKYGVYGLLLGVFGSFIVAFFAGKISDALEGVGQEVFNGSILLIAAFMIGWTVIWMRSHAREIVAKVKKVGTDIKAGDLHMFNVTIVIALASWREGAEIVLFSYGILATGATISSVLFGSAIGMAIGAIVGTALYLGLLRIPSKYFFGVTSWMLILLSCGLAASAAGYFAAAGIIPELIPQLWDSSWLIEEKSVVGQILHALIGYNDRPSGIQVIFYLATLAIIALLMKKSISK